jgi:Amiloride-sensitive sodium channel
MERFRDSEVMIFYKTEKFNPFILKRKFTELDFISYTGGALGLFLGFSALSFVEIIYYFTIRICFEKYKLIKIGVGHSIVPERSNLFRDYLSSSSIHGLKQMNIKGRHAIERLIWFTIFSLALVYCGISTYDIFENYINSPIIMTYEDVAVTTEDVS